MKLVSWNVNGIRACAKDGLVNWMQSEKPDVLCLQEIKATPEQLEPELRDPKGYLSIWNPAKKPGYSGTALFTKKEPHSVEYGLGIPKFDQEGRVLIVKFKDYTLVNSYFPNSQRDHARLPFKLEFCKAFAKKINSMRDSGENVVLCADWNIAHKEIDLKNPKTNVKNAGFLPEERAWMDQFIQMGYIDTFRHFNQDGGHYTWWSYRPGVREKNIGWRLDYFMTNHEHKDRLKKSYHRNDVFGSDHCPVVLELKK